MRAVLPSTVSNTPVFRSTFDDKPDSNTKPSKGTVMAKTKFRPLHDRVVFKRIDAEAKTKGGIIIPDSAKEKPSQGEITAVGPGGRDEAGKLIPIDLTACCSANGRAPKSSSMAKSS
jgi:hypothetical protein